MFKKRLGSGSEPSIQGGLTSIPQHCKNHPRWPRPGLLSLGSGDKGTKKFKVILGCAELPKSMLVLGSSAQMAFFSLLIYHSPVSEPKAIWKTLRPAHHPSSKGRECHFSRVLEFQLNRQGDGKGRPPLWWRGGQACPLAICNSQPPAYTR